MVCEVKFLKSVIRKPYFTARWPHGVKKHRVTDVRMGFRRLLVDFL